MTTDSNHLKRPKGDNEADLDEAEKVSSSLDPSLQGLEQTSHLETSAPHLNPNIESETGEVVRAQIGGLMESKEQGFERARLQILDAAATKGLCSPIDNFGSRRDELYTRMKRALDPKLYEGCMFADVAKSYLKMVKDLWSTLKYYIDPDCSKNVGYISGEVEEIIDQLNNLSNESPVFGFPNWQSFVIKCNEWLGQNYDKESLALGAFRRLDPKVTLVDVAPFLNDPIEVYYDPIRQRVMPIIYEKPAPSSRLEN